MTSKVTKHTLDMDDCLKLIYHNWTKGQFLCSVIGFSTIRGYLSHNKSLMPFLRKALHTYIIYMHF